MSQLKKAEFKFPSPHRTSEDGLLCVGGDLGVETLREAYGKGIFPWPQEGFPLLWFSPPRRGVMEFKDLHVSKSLRRFLNRTEIDFTVDRAFDRVIDQCAAVFRRGQDGTWILPQMVEAYKSLHAAGDAHSFEIWREGKLVGGLYGVYIAGVFSGESMFFSLPNMSKVALLKTIDYLKAGGLEWMDIQMVTPHLQAMGGKYISRNEFQRRLAKSRHLPGLFPAAVGR